jgi:outer membrane protein assembly factor BamB
MLLPGGLPDNFPSIPVFVPGGPHVWVGGSDSRLHRLNATDGSPFDAFPLGTPSIVTAVGSPTIDLLGGFVYVGTEAGRIYAIQP